MRRGSQKGVAGTYKSARCAHTCSGSILYRPYCATTREDRRNNTLRNCAPATSTRLSLDPLEWSTTGTNKHEKHASACSWRRVPAVGGGCRTYMVQCAPARQYQVVTRTASGHSSTRAAQQAHHTDYVPGARTHHDVKVVLRRRLDELQQVGSTCVVCAGVAVCALCARVTTRKTTQSVSLPVRSKTRCDISEAEEFTSPAHDAFPI